MTTTKRPWRSAAITEWTVKRGVLFLLLQMPVAALLAGFLLRMTTLPIATFGVFISFAVLTVWVSHRKTVSDDPGEPVHHVHRYALYALLPFVIFSIARIPMFFADGLVYWQLWYGFGAQLTGEPGTQLSTLAAGMVMYTLQGMALAMSYYVLFKRHSLINALLFLGGMLPALFVYIFPVFSLPGLPLGLAWYATHLLAHVVMAVTAWAMPALWTRIVPALRLRVRALVLAGFVLVLAAPYAFAVERALNWQFAEQQRVDVAAFDRVIVEPADRPVRTSDSAGDTARYAFTLAVHRSVYTNAAGVSRVVDAGPIDVTGQLVAGETPIAWCFGHIGKQTGPNANRDPAAFADAVRQLRPVSVPITCTGPIAATGDDCRTGLTTRWTADITLIGDRTTQRRQNTGQASAGPDLRACPISPS